MIRTESQSQPGIFHRLLNLLPKARQARPSATGGWSIEPPVRALTGGGFSTTQTARTEPAVLMLPAPDPESRLEESKPSQDESDYINDAASNAVPAEHTLREDHAHQQLVQESMVLPGTSPAGGHVQIPEAETDQVPEAETYRAAAQQQSDAHLNSEQPRLPDEVFGMGDGGQVVETQEHWQAAAVRFAEVRRLFPARLSGYSDGADALSRLGKFPDAEAVLEAGQRQLPDETVLFVDHARLAERQKDWVALAARCADVRERFPDEPWGYAGGAMALRHQHLYDEAKLLLTEADLRFPTDYAVSVEYARAADDQGDWVEAAHWCNIIREHFPDQSWGYVGGAHALDMQGHHEEAQALIEEGLSRVPEATELFEEYCWLAQNRCDWMNATKRWQAFRYKFPDAAVSYSAESMVLQKLDRHYDAESLMMQGLQHFPEDEELLAAYAFLASDRHQWQEALVRWSAYLNRFPDHAVGYVHSAIALREQARFDDADAMVLRGLKLHPGDSELLANYAFISGSRGDWHEALVRWQSYLARFPNHVVGYIHFGIVHRELAQFDEAEAIFQRGLERFPNDSELIANLAWIACHKAEWSEALQRWKTYCDEFPNDPLGHEQTTLVLERLNSQLH